MSLERARERFQRLQAARLAYRALMPEDRDLFRAEMEAESQNRGKGRQSREALAATLADASALTAERKTSKMTYRDAVLRVLVGGEPLGSSAIGDHVVSFMPDANSASIQAEVNRMLKDKLVAERDKTPQGFAAYGLTAKGQELARTRKIQTKEVK